MHVGKSVYDTSFDQAIVEACMPHVMHKKELADVKLVAVMAVRTAEIDDQIRLAMASCKHAKVANCQLCTYTVLAIELLRIS